MKVYVLEDEVSPRSTGPELMGVYASIVPAINAALNAGDFTVKPQYMWHENSLSIDGVYTITETEVLT